MATRTQAADGDAGGVDGEGGRVGEDPGEGCEGVVDGGREGRFGAVAVVDVDDDGAEGLAGLAAEGLVGEEGADYPAALFGCQPLCLVCIPLLWLFCPYIPLLFGGASTT